MRSWRGLVRPVRAVGESRPVAARRGPGGPGRSARRRGRGSPAPPRRPRRASPARRAAAAGSPGCAPGARPVPGRTRGSASPASWSTTSASRSRAAEPRNGVPARPTGAIPCQPGRKRPSAAGSTGSTSRRSRASDRRRSWRRTSGSHHSRSAPPGRNSPRTSVPGDQQPLEGVLDDPRREAPAAGRLGRQERAVGARPAGEQPVERAGHRGEERLRHADRRRDAHAVAIAGDVLDGDPAVLAGDPGPDRAATGRQLGEPAGRDRRPVLDPRDHLVERQVAEPAQEVVHPVDGRRLAVVGQRLERELEVGQRLGVEQLAQLLLAQQLAQQVAVERQRAGAALGERRVAVVHVRGDVVEEEAARERARPLRLDAVDRDLAPRHAGQHLAQRRQVEDVAEALAVRLDEDREAAVARRHRQQVGGALALLPERRPRPGPAARQEQRPRRVLAEAAGEQRRGRDLPDDQVLDLVGVGEEQVLDAVERGVALGQPDRDAVVGPDGLDLEPAPLEQPRFDRHRPRRVDPPAERRQQAQPPVARARRGSARRRSACRSAARRSPRARRRDRRAGCRRPARRGRGARAAAWSRPLRPRSPFARSASISPMKAPIARPSSIGRPTASPFQNGSLPGTPGAGVTVTRSWPISSTRQLLAPSTMTSPCIPARSS